MITRLVIIRCRHGPHTLVASALPFVNKIRKETVIGKLLYTGATIRHCHIFMLRRQKLLLDKARTHFKEKKSNELENDIMTIKQIDPF